MVVHRNIHVKGRVQGVFFRATTKEKADELGIKGFVRNEPDGSVYIEAEGEEQKMEDFLVYCRRGPAAARVDDVQVEEGRAENFSTFEVAF